ncbi:hypothetical protein BH10BAC6_BH10BAC6_17640 [soil metagenome]
MKTILRVAISVALFAITYVPALTQNSATWEVWRDTDLFKLSTHTTDSATYTLVGRQLTIQFELRETFRTRPTRRLQITIPNFTGIGNYDPSTGTTTYWENFSTTEKCACFDHIINDVNITKYDSVKKEIGGTFNWKCSSTVSGSEINYRIRNGAFDLGAEKIALALTPQDSIVVATLTNDTTLRVTVNAKRGTAALPDVKIFVNNKVEEAGTAYTEKGTTNASGTFVYDFSFPKSTPSGNYVISFVGEKADVKKSDTAKVTVYWGSRFWNYTCAGLNVLEFDAGEGREWKPVSAGSPILKSAGPVTIGGILRVDGPMRINTTAGQIKVFVDNGAQIVLPNVHFSATETVDVDLTNITDNTSFPLPDCDGIISLAIGSDSVTKRLSRKLPGGIELSIKEFKIINRADAKGLSIKGKITVAQAKVGCDAVADSAGGFVVPDDQRQGLTVGVAITTAGWESLTFEAEAIALTHAVCMNQFAVNADFLNEVYSLAGKFTFPVKGTEISLSGGVLFKNNPANPDNKLHFDSLVASLELGECKPIAQTPLCFKALSLSTSGWSNPNANGRAVRAVVTLNSLEQAVLDRAQWVKTLFGEPVICELDGTVEYRHPLIFTGAIGAKFIKIPKLSAAKPWQMEGIHAASIDLNNSIGVTGSYKIGHLGIDDYFLSANGNLTFFWNPTIGLSATVTGLIRIPAAGGDVLNIPAAGALLRFLTLSGLIPQTLGTASASVLVHEDNGFSINATVDVTQHPVSFVRSLGRMSVDFSYKDSVGLKFRHDTLGSIHISQKLAESSQGVAKPIDTIVVDNSIERLIVLISGATTAPVSSITAPNGTVYSTTSADSTVQFFRTPGSEMSAWTVLNPTPGNWILTLTSPKAGDEVEIIANRSATPFSIAASENSRVISVTWDPTTHTNPSDEVRLFLDTDKSGFNGVFIGTAKEQTGTFTFTLPAEMTECTYYVHATRNVSGQPLVSTYSTTRISTAGSGVPSPVEVRALSNQLGQTSVSWRMAPGSLVNGFLIYVRDGQGMDSLYATAFAEDRMVMIDVVEQSTKQIVVVAFDNQGRRGCATDALAITTGIEEAPFVQTGESNHITVSIVPNPAQDRTTIRFTCGETNRSQASVQIVDVLGKVIATLDVPAPTTGWNSVEWNVAGYPAGTYYAKIVSPLGQAFAQLSVIK